jgi:hypothetical protein
MKTQGEHIRTLRRRVDFLKARDYRNSYDQAELGALEWALVNLPPAQPAPVQEPVAWIEHHKGGDNLEWDNPGGKCTPLYTTPPAAQRQWVGLTDEEIMEMYNEPRSDAEMIAFGREVEAKLKEKNT